jgi:hypothetical protein
MKFALVLATLLAHTLAEEGPNSYGLSHYSDEEQENQYFTASSAGEVQAFTNNQDLLCLRYPWEVPICHYSFYRLKPDSFFDRGFYLRLCPRETETSLEDMIGFELEL